MLRDVKVVGFYKGISKRTGKEYVNLSVTYKREPGERDVELAGDVAETFFVPDHVASKLSAVDVGKTIKIVDAFYGGKNNLVDVMR